MITRQKQVNRVSGETKTSIGNHIEDGEELDVIILMAGEGRRLRPFTEKITKAMLPCQDGKTIVQKNIENIKKAFKKSAYIPVVGHAYETALAHLQEIKMNQEANTPDIEHVYNPFYAETGPLTSLWAGLLKSNKENLLVVNGDTIYSEALIFQIKHWMSKQKRDSAALCISKKKTYMPDEMKVKLSDTDTFLEVGKNIQPLEAQATSAGALCIKGIAAKRKFSQHLEKTMSSPDALTKTYPWHHVLNTVPETFLLEMIWTPSTAWEELDTVVDFKEFNQTQTNHP